MKHLLFYLCSLVIHKLYGWRNVEIVKAGSRFVTIEVKQERIIDHVTFEEL
jgi:hypothetical protein